MIERLREMTDRVRRVLTRPDAGVATAALSVMVAALVASCSAGPGVMYAPPTATRPLGAPRIVSAGRPLECVPYARQLSGIQIHGDASTWWWQAAGRYRRGHVPEVGAVLVYKHKRASTGHLAVVIRVIDSRTIVADHANWLNHGRIHENTPIRDVSPGNDWTAVRTWYIPGDTWGGGIYPTYGFIYPEPVRTAEQ